MHTQMKSKNDIRIQKQVERLGRPSLSMLDREIERLERNESLKRVYYGLLTSILSISAVFILITNLWLSALVVDGSSMNPQLLENDIVLAVACQDPVRYDIIAFSQSNKLYIKRVIATEGDKVILNSEGIISVNGEVLAEPYVTRSSLGNSDIEFPYVVPHNTVFVLGDNRAISTDSRDSRFGPVNKDQILGKVTLTIWPPPKIGIVF